MDKVTVNAPNDSTKANFLPPTQAPHLFYLHFRSWKEWLHDSWDREVEMDKVTYNAPNDSTKANLLPPTQAPYILYLNIRSLKFKKNQE